MYTVNHRVIIIIMLSGSLASWPVPASFIHPEVSSQDVLGFFFLPAGISG
jgi:hypothetical protein